MAGRLTIWGAGQLLTGFFGNTAEPPPVFYLALIRNVPPTPYLSGTELDEPDPTDNPDYARVAIPNNFDNWANDSQPQEIYNTQVASFITATTEWGMINYWALCNAIEAGFCLIVGALEEPTFITIGDQAVFEEGDLSVSLGPFFLADEA